ncbi:MAG: hypothetical protein V5A15_06200 [Haloarcula sp.]
MRLPSHRHVRLAGFVVAALLLALAVYPGTFGDPYVTASDSPKYAHTIVPESSPLYDEYTAGYDHEVYQYEELSPVAQELFDRTRAAEPREQYNGERRYIPAVCRDFMLVCDTYYEDDLPEEFTYGTQLDYEEAFVFIEDGSDRYLLQTGWTGQGGLFAFPVRFALSLVTLVPLAGFIGLLAARSTDTGLLTGAVGGGILVAVASLVSPYLEMTGVVSGRAIGVVCLVAVWLSIIATGGRGLYRRVTGS